MTKEGIRRLIMYENVFYPKARRAADYAERGRAAIEEAYMTAFDGADDDKVLDAYMRIVRRGAPFPSVGQVLQEAGGYRTISGADIDRMNPAAIPMWRAAMLADIQDGRPVQTEDFYINKYGQ